MGNLLKVFIAMLLVTSSEGGLNTVFPPFLEHSHFSISQIGFIISVFAILQLLSRLPAGALYSAHRARLIVVSALLLLAASIIGYAYLVGAPFVIVLTLLHGLAFGTVTTVMLALCIEVKPEGYSSGAVMGWYTASLSAGYAIGNSLGGFVADHLGYTWSFLIIGLFPLGSALVVAVLPSFAGREVRSVAAAPTSQAADQPGLLSKMHRLRKLGPNILLATGVAFYINFLDDAFSAFFPLFGLSVGLSLTTVGLLRSLKSLTATSIRPLSGFVFKHIDFKTVNNVGLITWSVAVFLLPGLRGTWSLGFLFIIFGLSRGLIRVTSATMVAQEKAGDGQRIGLASGLYNAGLDGGAMLGPPVGGLLASATDIPTMFRLVPCSLLLLYFGALALVGRASRVPVSVEISPSTGGETESQ